MDILESLYRNLQPTLAPVGTLFVVIVMLFIARWFLERRQRMLAQQQFQRQLIMLLLSFAGLIAVIISLPMESGTKGQLLSLIGILLSAAIALSSTTFVGNAMAAVMLRAVRNFRSGDFVKVGEHFGRVSERGLFHTEIQTEDRDLTTLPNLYLVTNPVTVMRKSGTIISATVSLGYDVPRKKIESLLLEAARDAELDDPFVQILDLGDFSVTYRAAGLLTEVKQVLSTRSRLRCTMLDALHGGGIEIVSPTFMNQRQVGSDARFLPPLTWHPPEQEWAQQEAAQQEAIAFDKADQAESLEMLRGHHEKLTEQIDKLRAAVKEIGQEEERTEVGERVTRLEAAREELELAIREREKQEADDQ